MLTVSEYNLRYPHYPLWEMGLGFDGRILSEGALLFKEEEAEHWAGPLPGNYAYFIVQDYTNASYPLGKKRQKYLDVIAQAIEETKSRVARGYYHHHPNESPHWYRDQPSYENPIRLYLAGTDDTSYSKFYPNDAAALGELDLFIAAEPLGFYELIDGFDFIFTN